MEITTKKMTDEEWRQHQHFVIQQWKKNVAEAKDGLKAKIKSPEYKEMLKRLKQSNARKGVIIPGKV